MSDSRDSFVGGVFTGAAIMVLAQVVSCANQDMAAKREILIQEETRPAVQVGKDSEG